MKNSYICTHEYNTILGYSKIQSTFNLNTFPILKIAKQSLQIEFNSIAKLFKCFDSNFEAILEALHSNNGKVVITGIGKSGLIAQKIVATLSSTGTPAVFMHAGDASHGDLGCIQPNDIVMCLSKSGQSGEIDFIIPFLKTKNIPLIALTFNQHSPLALAADYLIVLPKTVEADGQDLAPTTSTTLQLILGDIIAVCLMHLNQFKKSDFASLHPGGYLGKKLNLTLGQMVSDNKKAMVNKTASIKEVLQEITTKRLGATVVLDKNQIVGFITDGDLRRMLEKNFNLTSITAADIMTSKPLILDASTKAIEALSLMNKRKVNHLVVCSKDSHYLGIVHILDFTKEGLKDEY